MSWLSRFRNAIDSKHLDIEVAEELEDHIVQRAKSLTANGMDEAEAYRQAAVFLGNRTRLMESTREARLWPQVEQFLQDVRFGVRLMHRSPGFSAVAMLSLALAIGANTAIYSIVDAALLSPLPVSHPEDLISLAKPGIEERGRATESEGTSFSFPLYQQFRAASRGTGQLAIAGYPVQLEIRGSGDEVSRPKIMQQWISGNLFRVLQTGPAALGRLFSDQDDRVVGGAPYAVLSYDYWQRRYQGDERVLGKTIHLAGTSPSSIEIYEVVGVAPKGFFGTEPGKMVDVWLPVAMYEKPAFSQMGWNFFAIIGRLMPGTTPQRVQQSLQPAFHACTQDLVKNFSTMPDYIRNQFVNMQLRVHPAASGISHFRLVFAKPLWIVLGVAAGLLLIACANIATLLLARSSARAPEMAMRFSLGANRARLVRQLLTEGLLFSIAGGAGGWLIARIASPALVSILSRNDDPIRLMLALDTRVLLFCALVCALATAFFGSLPAWYSTRQDPMAVLHRMTGQAGKLRLGSYFVGFQIAFAFCLMMAGASFLFTLLHLLSVNPGFDTRGVTVVTFADKAQPEPKRLALMHQLAYRLSAATHIDGVALAPWRMFAGTGWSSQVILPGKHPSEREEIFYPVSPKYFSTLRTQMVLGRDFNGQDNADREPIAAVVNRAFEQRYFGNGSALGQTFRRPDDNDTKTHVIVGVVQDAHYGDLRRSADPMVYVPMDGRNDFVAYVRSSATPGTVARMAAQASRELGSDMHVVEVTTLAAIVGNTILQEKLLAGLGTAFALLGLVLAAIGLFGTLNYSVIRRTKELGIRGALGANRVELVRLVFQDFAPVIAGGLAAGIAGSFTLLIALQSLLFGVKPIDPTVMGTALGLFIIAAVFAGGIPAVRAASVDPMVALRQD